jgi:hypothetical protein
VGQRATKSIRTKIFSLGLAKHSYHIVMGDMAQVLGNDGSSHNQQVRTNDSRAVRGKEHTIYLSPDQAQALHDGSESLHNILAADLTQVTMRIRVRFARAARRDITFCCITAIHSSSTW